MFLLNENLSGLIKTVDLFTIQNVPIKLYKLKIEL